MNIATVRLRKSKGWQKLEELIKIKDPNFNFKLGGIYDIQLLTGAIQVCECSDTPNNEGFIFKTINGVFTYVKGEKELYIIPSNYEYASVNIGDRK